MNVRSLLEVALFSQVILSIAVASTLLVRRAFRIFPQLLVLVLAEVGSVGVSLALLYFKKPLHIKNDLAYTVFFWTAWISNAIAFLLRLLIVWTVFAEAMRPMSGLHKAGKLIFRWVAVVSALVTLSLVAGPGVFSSMAALINTLDRLQQGTCVLTLCLLVFVCFAVRPLGLTFRSHLFGVSLGLGISAVVDLVGTAWFQFAGSTSIYSPITTFTSFGSCVALLVWLSYFAAPEPARKMILLPTTSPFFFWNRISEILGDSPGHVAVAGFSPSMLAPAEIEMLTAATTAEREAEARTDTENVLPFPSPEGHPTPELSDFLPSRQPLAV